MHTKLIIAIIAYMTLFSCGTEVRVASPLPKTSLSVNLLADGLTGSFSSHEHATQDATFKDMAIHTVSIWPDRPGKRWIYFEQNATDTPTSPVQQQIHSVGPGSDGEWVLEIFAFPEGRTPPAGTYTNPEWFNRLDPMFLKPMAGCTVHFTQKGDVFTGKTRGNGCPDTLHDADHMTGEITVSKNEIRMWYRGWSSSGEQVHGSPTGPQVYLRTGS